MDILRTRISIASLNTRGLLDHKKRGQVKRVIAEDDICLLQETHGTKSNTGCWKLNLGKEKGEFAFFKKNARGVGIIHDSGVSSNGSACKDKKGRIAARTIRVGEITLGVVNVYAPNLAPSIASQEDYCNFLISLEHFIDGIKDDSDYLVVGGDWNMILNPKLDSEGSAKCSKVCVEQLKELMNKFDLQGSRAKSGLFVIVIKFLRLLGSKLQHNSINQSPPIADTFR